LTSLQKGESGEQQSLQDRQQTAKEMLVLIDKLEAKGTKSEVDLLQKIAKDQPGSDTKSVIQSTINHLSSLSDDTESFKEILITLSDQIKSYLLELEENLGVSAENSLTLQQSLQVNIQLESELVTGFHNELVNVLKDKSLSVGHQKDALTIARLIDAESSVISAEISSLLCDDESSPPTAAPVDQPVPSPPEPIVTPSPPSPPSESSPSPSPSDPSSSPPAPPSDPSTDELEESPPTEAVEEFDNAQPETTPPLEDTLDAPPAPVVEEQKPSEPAAAEPPSMITSEEPQPSVPVQQDAPSA